MKVHTLGPTSTDSYCAARHFQMLHPELTIELHSSFEEIYSNLSEWVGDLLIVPTAFRDQEGSSWGDLHYRYVERLTLQTAFVANLQPMVVIRSKRSTNIAYTHPATANYLSKQIPPTVQLRYCASKAEAYRRYCKDGEYVMTSAKLVAAADEILTTVHTQMVWSVYLIKEEKDEFINEYG